MRILCSNLLVGDKACHGSDKRTEAAEVGAYDKRGVVIAVT